MIRMHYNRSAHWPARPDTWDMSIHLDFIKSIRPTPPAREGISGDACKIVPCSDCIPGLRAVCRRAAYDTPLHPGVVLRGGKHGEKAVQQSFEISQLL